MIFLYLRLNNLKLIIANNHCKHLKILHYNVHNYLPGVLLILFGVLLVGVFAHIEFAKTNFLLGVFAVDTLVFMEELIIEAFMKDSFLDTLELSTSLRCHLICGP